MNNKKDRNKKDRENNREDNIAERLIPILKKDPLKAEKIFDQMPFKKRIDLILKTSGKLRQDLIIQSREAKKLVLALPEEELFYTIKDIGIRDSIPIISLASPEQVQYILDIDLWKKDQINVHKCHEWLEILVECGDEKVYEWLETVDYDLLVLIFKRLISVQKVEDTSAPPPSLPSFTLDNIYWIEFLNEEARPSVTRILQILRGNDADLFFALMEGILGFSSEVEEDAFHWRECRLKDKGFPDFDEAHSIYRYFRKEKLSLIQKDIIEKRVEEVPPFYPIALKDTPLEFWDALFLRLKEEEDIYIEEKIRYNLTLLSNKVIIADSLDLDNLESIREALLKVYGYLNIALQILSEGDINKGLEILRNINMTLLFQIGYSRALDLQIEAKRIIRKSLLGKLKEGISILDSPLEEIIRGVVRKKPLLFNEKEKEYREFRSLSDIQLVERALEKMKYILKLFEDYLALSYAEVENLNSIYSRYHPHELKLSTIFLTYFSNYIVEGIYQFKPIEIKKMKNLLLTVWEEKKDDKILPEIRKDLKRDFLKHLTEISKKEEKEKYLYEFVEDCFKIFREEFGLLSPNKEVDLRFIKGLILV